MSTTVSKPIKAIVLCFGFAENSLISSVIFNHYRGIKGSRKEALVSLAQFLFAKRQADFPEACSACLNSPANSDFPFCDKCGHRLGNNRQDENLDDFQQWSRELGVATLNDFGYDDDETWVVGWTAAEIHKLDKSQFFVIAESAEKVLRACLEKDSDIDQILSRRKGNCIYMNGIP